MKYIVSYARIEHQIYRLEIEANNPDEAKYLALEEFTGDEPFEVVHAEEFINQVDEVTQ